jgi:hypothetical protein
MYVVIVMNDVTNMGIAKWRQIAQGRDGWSRATGETLVLLG